MRKKRIALVIIFCIVFSNIVFANNSNDTDDTYKYSLGVNIKQNIVTVYELDDSGEYTIPDRAFICSVGEDTPCGSFKTSDKYIWRELFGNVYGQYATRVTGHILFHSVPYYTMNKDDLEYDEYNKLGTTASMGCIRLCVKDAKWIYDNCPSGTEVNITDSDSAEPLPKPEAYSIDINDTQKRGWDPTDPDLSNPYINDGKDYIPRPDAVLDLAGMSINGNMYYSDCYNIDGSNYFKISDIDKIYESAGIPFSYNYADTKQAKSVLIVNTSYIPSDSDYEKIKEQSEDSFTKPVLVLYGNQKECIDVYSINGEDYYNIRDIAKISQLDILWDKTNNCIELVNNMTT